MQLLLKLCSKLYCEIQGHSVGVFVLHSKSIQVSLYVLLVYSREKKKGLQTLCASLYALNFSKLAEGMSFVGKRQPVVLMEKH